MVFKKNLIYVYLIILIAGLFTTYFLIFKANANEETFYPQNCLGSFTNPEKAALKPEVDSLDKINELNSAVYYSGFKEIYCGDFSNFKNETSTNSKIQKITLSFNYIITKELIGKPVVATQDENGVLNVLEQIIPPQTIEIINNESTSTNTEASTTQNITETSSTDESVNPPTQTETPLLQTETSSTQTETSSTQTETQSIQNNDIISPENSLPAQPENQSNNQEIPMEQNPTQEIQNNDSSFFNFISFAFAQNLENDILNSNDSTTIQLITQSTTENLTPSSSLETNSSSINTTDSNLEINTSSESSTESLKINTSSIENIESNGTSSTSTPTSTSISKPLFDVYYTLDGSNWNYLGSINNENWQNLTFDIPVNKDIDLSKIQIKINSYPDTDYYMYLESLNLKVEYADLELINSSSSLDSNLQANVSIVSNNLNNNIQTSENINNTTITEEESTPEKELETENENVNNEILNAQQELTNIPLPEPLKIRKIEKTIKIQNKDNLSCNTALFNIKINEEETKLSELNLNLNNSLRTLEIGSLPQGIDVVFENGDYNLTTSNSKVVLKIYRQKESQKGNFNIPVIYSEDNSTIICQLNIEAF